MLCNECRKVQAQAIHGHIEGLAQDYFNLILLERVKLTFIVNVSISILQYFIQVLLYIHTDTGIADKS